jgi:hypothetical protein
VTRSRAAAVAAIALLVVPLASGCYQSLDNTVSVMGPTGNGVELDVGPIQVKNVTLVAGSGGRAASLVFTAVNPGDTADALTTVTVAGTNATISTAPLVVPPGGAVAVGGDSKNQVAVTGLTVPAGSYTDVKMSFRVAGSASRQVLVVPGEGYYADYAPGGASATVEATEPAESEASAAATTEAAH